MDSNPTSLVLSENDIQNGILEFLRFKKIVAWRNNNGAVYDEKSGTFRRKNKWEKIHGDPVDILGVLPDGKFLAIEVKKDENEKATPGQIKFMNRINKSGGVAFKAYSVRCVKVQLENYLP